MLALLRVDSLACVQIDARSPVPRLAFLGCDQRQRSDYLARSNDDLLLWSPLVEHSLLLPYWSSYNVLQVSKSFLKWSVTGVLTVLVN